MSHDEKAIAVLECVQQNINDPAFIDWLYATLGLEVVE